MAAVEKTRQRGRCEERERERERRGKDERAQATHRAGGVRQRHLRATCPISPIYANRHPRGWLLTVSSSLSFRALPFLSRLCLPAPSFHPLCLSAADTPAPTTMQHRRHRCPKAANRKTQRHCLSRCERRADANTPSVPPVSPILFARRLGGKCFRYLCA